MEYLPNAESVTAKISHGIEIVSASASVPRGRKEPQANKTPPESKIIHTKTTLENERPAFTEGQSSQDASSQSTVPSQSLDAADPPLSRKPLNPPTARKEPSTNSYYQPDDPVSEYFRRQLPMLRDQSSLGWRIPDSTASSKPDKVKNSDSVEPARLSRPQDRSPLVFHGIPSEGCEWVASLGSEPECSDFADNLRPS